MVKLHFETLAPGMKARLDAPRRARQVAGSLIVKRGTIRRLRHASVNCMLADAVKMPFHRTQA